MAFVYVYKHKLQTCASMDEANLFKDPKMLQRFQDISVLPEKEKECLLTTVDHFIKSAKISAM